MRAGGRRGGGDFEEICDKVKVKVDGIDRLEGLKDISAGRCIRCIYIPIYYFF